MSNVIKSFRVFEIDADHEMSKDSQASESVDGKVKEVLLGEARAEADIIIQIAEERSKQISKDIESERMNIINAAHEEAKKILEEAKNIGYSEGYEKGFEEGLDAGFDKGYRDGKVISDKLIKESLELKEDYISQKNKLLEELEEDIIELVIEIYKKILDKEIAEDDSTITSLVLNGIKNLDSTDKLTIIGSKEDFEILEMARDEILAKASLINELEIKYDINLAKGDCILETAKGNIDISIKDQVKEIKETLRTILNNE